MFRVQVSQPRSLKHHRRTMGIIHVAFNNWPEGHEFKPHDEKEFRAWLQCKAGYCGRSIFEFGDDMTPNAIAGTAQAAVIEAKSHDLPSRLISYPIWRIFNASLEWNAAS